MYVSLHNHSDYSNVRGLDSINTLEEIISKALELNFTGIAITDHDILSGHIKATQIYEKLDPERKMKLILGNEIYISREGLNAENYEKGEKLFHFLLLSLNAEGHKQMREISTRAWERSFYRNVPRTPTFKSDLKEIIQKNQGNVVATTACLAGFPGTYYGIFKEGAAKMIETELAELEEIFGKGNFFIEIQPSFLKEHKDFNKFMIEHFWGKYPFVFTTDSHYITSEDALYHEQFLQSKNKSRDVSSFYSNNYLMTYEEIQAAFNYIEKDKIEEMRLNTLSIGERVEYYTLKNEQIIPTTPIDFDKRGIIFLKELLESLTDKKYEYIDKYLNTNNIYNIDFIQKVFKGFIKKTNIETINLDKYLSRINEELGEIWETSIQIHQPLSKYFTTMAKMIDIIWEDGDSLVGISRGSAAGFLVNYYLGITQIDPLNQPLVMPHWRFIHRDRPGLPDIDIDSEGDKRNKVFNRVKEYFVGLGGDFINVSTFGTEKAKSALRTAGRALDIEDDAISYIVSMIPNERGFDWDLTECMYGRGERKPLPSFQTEMAKNKNLWNLAYKIEGLITNLSVHASGVVAVNEPITEHNSVMKTSRGIRVTAFNLEDTEYAGGIKYDFLTINALDKIRTTMNLLLEDGMIDWHDTLRKTYEHYLLPVNLDYNSQKMWQMVADGQIVDLFQFDTQVGTQAVRLIKPTNIAELSVANSVMRLMPEGEGELPLNTYASYKHDIRAWYNEMKRAGLNDNEVKVLEEHLLPLSGVADSQESAMMLVMDERIAGFTVTEANSLRRAIGKKEIETMRATEKMFYEKGKALGTSKKILDYVWNTQIYRQAGYSFSTLHTMGYSTIALQEMNLAYKFPIIYWNTACLSVNAGAINEEDYHALIEDEIVVIDDEEDEDKKSGKVQYGKISSAIEKFRKELGLKVALPDINKARFGFVPDPYRNEVLFGLKGISRIGDKLIETIIENRPYESLWDFIEKLNGQGKTIISKDRVVLLIKAGAFDNLTEKTREELLKDFILSVADQKKKLNLQNAKMLIDFGLIPDELDYQKRIYNYTRYIRRTRDADRNYILDDIAQEFYYENSYDISKIKIVPSQGENLNILSSSYWDSVYETEMNYIRNYIKENHDSLLEQLNTILFNEEYEKYATGNRLRWELQALGFYHEAHELEGVAETFPDSVKISSLDEIEDMKTIGSFLIRGKRIPKYEIYHIIGTVLDKDKQKHTIVFSTPNGVVDVKMYRNQFAILDRVDFVVNEDGEKKIIQDSFLKKGTFLMISGIKEGDIFQPKTYKEHGIDPVLIFEVENGAFKIAHEKK